MSIPVTKDVPIKSMSIYKSNNVGFGLVAVLSPDASPVFNSTINCTALVCIPVPSLNHGRLERNGEIRGDI